MQTTFAFYNKISKNDKFSINNNNFLNNNKFSINYDKFYNEGKFLNKYLDNNNIIIYIFFSAIVV